MGVYQTGVAKNKVENNGASKPVLAHVYEYTAQMCVGCNVSPKGGESVCVHGLTTFGGVWKVGGP